MNCDPNAFVVSYIIGVCKNRHHVYDWIVLVSNALPAVLNGISRNSQNYRSRHKIPETNTDYVAPTRAAAQLKCQVSARVRLQFHISHQTPAIAIASTSRFIVYDSERRDTSSHIAQMQMDFSFCKFADTTQIKCLHATRAQCCGCSLQRCDGVETVCCCWLQFVCDVVPPPV